MNQEILDTIPQRPPFLFVDEIVERTEATIHTRKRLSGREDFFQGHFPGMPVMPGVLQLEAVFQTGALLISGNGKNDEVGVVTRADEIKFKKIVKPGDVLDIFVEKAENIGNAYYMKGKITVDGKVAVVLKFACQVVPRSTILQ